ncbi:MAG: DEAD/DEAH box helicase [Dehalococcoidia bacterium]|nr:DEAD/DEAH box helicase [Dehalococcoidia bacterium]
MSFDNFNFSLDILAGVRAQGYTTPTPIQRQGIPSIMSGRDVIGLAQTGTGKTAAFVLPTLQRLLDGPRGRVRALVMSPTRELAEQTCEAVCQLGKRTGLRSVAIYGGVNMDQQSLILRNGIDIVVACPGRLLDHVWRGSIDLSDVEVLVIDEADRMFDMGFLPDIRNILRCLMKPRQTLLFSATMSPEIRRLVEDILHDPISIQVDNQAPVASVSHALFPVKQHLKTPLLMELLYQIETDSVLVFTRTKIRAERLAQEIKAAGFRATSLQGNLSQPRRQAALDGFRTGSIKILVATDIAARGIDISSISHVINYDMPDGLEAYTHRIGRTGRVDQLGDAFTLVTAADALMVRDIERALNTKLELRTLPGFDYSAPAPERDRVRIQVRPPVRRQVFARR